MPRRPFWTTYDVDRMPVHWGCADETCGAEGAASGDDTDASERRAKHAAARHARDTGHPVGVVRLSAWHEPR